MIKSYITLPEAKGRVPDATFMVPQIASYRDHHHQAFVAAMSQAIRGAIATLEQIQVRKAVVEPIDIQNVLNEIAKIRRDIAEQLELTQGRDGVTEEEDDEQWKLFGKPLTNKSPKDLILPTPDHRHYSYLDRAREACDSGGCMISTSDGNIVGSMIIDRPAGG